MAKAAQNMSTLTTSDRARPIQLEKLPRRPNAPRPARAPPTMKPTPNTARKPAARGIQCQKSGRSSRSMSHTEAIIT